MLVRLLARQVASQIARWGEPENDIAEETKTQ